MLGFGNKKCANDVENRLVMVNYIILMCLCFCEKKLNYSFEKKLYVATRKTKRESEVKAELSNH